MVFEWCEGGRGGLLGDLEARSHAGNAEDRNRFVWIFAGLTRDSFADAWHTQSV